MNRFTKEIIIAADNKLTACELLATETGLSKGKIKDAMTKGAVWLKKKKGKLQRIRRATAALLPGSVLTIHYDAALLALAPPPASCISDQKHYSIWHKPAGLMAQGNQYGDHCSLLRQGEQHFHPHRPVFLVHRLDRETEGLMIIAHSREAAMSLSRLFQNHLIDKRYQVEILGNIFNRPENSISFPLDGKEAITEYEAVTYDSATNTSRVMVHLKTGRLHQIRRHFELIGHPVIGDPRYGTGNKNKKGLQLVADQLRFVCPFTKREMIFQLQNR